MSLISRTAHRVLKAAHLSTKKRAVPLFKDISYNQILTRPIHGAEGLAKQEGVGVLKAHTARSLAYLGAIGYELPKALYRQMRHTFRRLFPSKSQNIAQNITQSVRNTGESAAKKQTSTAGAELKKSAQGLKNELKNLRKASGDLMKQYQQITVANAKEAIQASKSRLTELRKTGSNLMKQYQQQAKTSFSNAFEQTKTRINTISDSLAEKIQVLGGKMAESSERFKGKLNTSA